MNDSTARTTRCPACGTRFRVTDAQLQAADGKLRCGSCLTVFVAEFEADPATPESTGDTAACEDRIGRGEAPAARHRTVLEVFDDGPLPAPEFHLDEVDLQAPSKRSPLPGLLLAGLLGAVLVAQYGWWRRESLSKVPSLHGAYQRACAVLGCTLPLRRDPSLIRSLRVVVREVGEAHDRLLLDALIVNEGSEPQPFPILELTMMTPDDRPLAARRFRPREYLSGELAGVEAMPPRTPVRVSLALVRPGDYGSYRIAFR